MATLCFLWVFSVNYCPDAPCQYQKPPNQSETYSQRWFPIPWNPNSTLQPQPEFADGAPKKYEYYDLQAQENMARATNVIAWATAVTVLTSVLGVFLLYSNLKVIGETNSIMRQEQRAWMTIALQPCGSIRNKYEDGEHSLIIPVSFVLTNLGQSPARDLRFGYAMDEVDWHLYNGRTTENDDIPNFAEARRSSHENPQDIERRRIVAPGQAIIEEFSTEISADMISKGSVFVAVSVTYKTDGVEHICDTHLGFRLLSRNENGVPMSIVLNDSSFKEKNIVFRSLSGGSIT